MTLSLRQLSSAQCWEGVSNAGEVARLRDTERAGIQGQGFRLKRKDKLPHLNPPTGVPNSIVIALSQTHSLWSFYTPRSLAWRAGREYVRGEFSGVWPTSQQAQAQAQAARL
jgi:hypothetical protein